MLGSVKCFCFGYISYIDHNLIRVSRLNIYIAGSYVALNNHLVIVAVGHSPLNDVHFLQPCTEFRKLVSFSIGDCLSTSLVVIQLL
jgi:hypothetical protein